MSSKTQEQMTEITEDDFNRKQSPPIKENSIKNGTSILSNIIFFI
jgi:hypothetical protein